MHPCVRMMQSLAPAHRRQGLPQRRQFASIDEERSQIPAFLEVDHAAAMVEFVVGLRLRPGMDRWQLAPIAITQIDGAGR